MPHRHTLAALRLAMMGEGAVTIVDGKACPMEPGDLILTPAWSWHEHRHDGSKPRGLVRRPRLSARARSSAPCSSSTGPGRSPSAGWPASADDALARRRHAARRRRRRVPLLAALPLCLDARDRRRWTRCPRSADGSQRHALRQSGRRRPGDADASTAMRCALARRSDDRRQRTTATAMVVVIEGEGESRIGDKTFNWKQHDVFTLPRWHVDRAHGSASGPRRCS